MQFDDLYENFFGAVGITYNSSGQYLLVGRSAQRGATYANFTADRVIYAPTDLVSIAGRILAFNASDQATAYQLGKGFNVSAYNPGGEPVVYTLLCKTPPQSLKDALICRPRSCIPTGVARFHQAPDAILV